MSWTSVTFRCALNGIKEEPPFKINYRFYDAFSEVFFVFVFFGKEFTAFYKRSQSDSGDSVQIFDHKVEKRSLSARLMVSSSNSSPSVELIKVPRV